MVRSLTESVFVSVNNATRDKPGTTCFSKSRRFPARREWPCGCAPADQLDELPSLHGSALGAQDRPHTLSFSADHGGGKRRHWAAPVSPTRLVNFITISLRGALMKPALTLATLIALDGTDHVQQGVISASAISPQKRRKRSWMRLRHRYAIPGRQNTIGQSLQQ